jgi:hypothetical protein
MAFRRPLKSLSTLFLIVGVVALVVAIVKVAISAQCNKAVVSTVLSENAPEYVTRHFGGRSWLEYPDIEDSINKHKYGLNSQYTCERLMQALQTKGSRTRRRIVFALGYIACELSPANFEIIQHCLENVVADDADIEVADEAAASLHRMK